MQVLHNSQVIDEYLMVMRREINSSKEYERLTRYVLSKIDVNTATQADIMKLLDSLRKPGSKWNDHFIYDTEMILDIFIPLMKHIQEIVKQVAADRRKSEKLDDV